MKKTLSILGIVGLLGAAMHAQGVAAPYVQNFDSLTGLPIVVTAGAPTPSFGTGEWDYQQTAGPARARILTNANISTNGPGVPPATNGNGPNFVSFDSSTAGTLATNTAVLHIDGIASDVFGGGFVIRVLLRETSDETTTNDVIAITDGVTTGFEVLNTGAAGTNPGYLGFKEVLLDNWNTSTPTIQTGWQERVYNITPGFLTSQGLVMGTDMCFILRQRDDNSVEGSDGFHFDNVRVDPILSTDVAVSAIVSPTTTGGCTTASSTVTVSLTNNAGLSLAAGTMIQMTYTVDAGTPVVETLTLAASLAANATINYSFTTPASFPVLGQTYAIAVTATLTGDQNNLNDSLSTAITSGFSLIGTWSETFSTISWSGTPTNGTTTGPAGWSQETTDATGTDSDWYFRNTDTPSAGTGPVADHTTGASGGTGYYAYVEDAGNFAGVNLRTPCCDVTSVTTPTLVFFYQILNGNTNAASPNQLHVDIITYPGAVVNLDVIPALNPTGAAWTCASVDLTPYQGMTFEIRFRGSSNGGSTLCDVCIDDVSVIDLQDLGGQKPQFGSAVLDVAGATDINGFDINCLQVTGPLARTLPHGSPLAMTFRGAAFQPIVLLTGPANIAAATIPSIGQLDIGNPAFPIPTNIVVLADGTQVVGVFGPAFVTGTNGSMGFSINSSSLPANFSARFQAVLYTGGPTVIAVSNAVDLTIL